MTKEELLKKIDFEKSWLYDCGIFGSDVDIAFHAIKKRVIEALEQESVIDKIRSEIEARLCDVVSDYTDGYRTAIQGVLAIIDKYKKGGAE